MTPQSYILLIEKSSQGDLEHTLAVLNIAGVGAVFYGSSNDFSSLALWVIYKAKNNPEKVKKQL